MTDLSAFDKFKTDAPAEPDEPEELSFRWKGKVVSIDQSISDTGWAVMISDGEKVMVTEAGIFHTDPDGMNIADTLRRGEVQMAALVQLLSRVQPDFAVHEMPAAISPRLKSRNKEAGPIAAMAVRGAFMVTATPYRMLNAQHVRNVFGLPQKADKGDVRDMVKKYIPGIADRADLRLNEHTYDSMGMGLVAIHEEGLADGIEH